MIAPNGKQSNLTDSQYKLVRTPAFKQWFGDWEFNPSEASKVVDENGEPLVVYHSSRYEFNTFKTKKVKTSTIQGHSIGSYFSNSEKESKRYGDKTRAYFLKFKKPLDFTDIKENSGKKGVLEFVERLPITNSLKHSIIYNSYEPIAYIILENADKTEKIISKIKKKNDGIIFYENEPNITYVAFEPNQIKLADGTNTTFDSNNNDIRYKRGGNINFKNNNMSKHKDGLFVGKSHKEGGIPMVVKSTGQRIEVEGGESITNKTSMADTKRRTLTGTNCEIISQINTQNGNGVAMDCDSVVGKKYKYEAGGQVSLFDGQEDFFGKKRFADGGSVTNYKLVNFKGNYVIENDKYYVVDETKNDYLIVNEDNFNRWLNADKFDRVEYYSEWIPKSEMVEIDKMSNGGSVSAKKIMGLRLALRVANNQDKKLIERRIKALEIAKKMEKIKTDSGTDDDLELLKNKIRNISKKMEYDGESGYGGYVVYLDKDKDKIQISTYTNLSPYSAQASDEVKVSFNAPNKTMIIFSTNVFERFEDNNSFEKYGGIKYIYEPFTNKIASEILEKIKL